LFVFTLKFELQNLSNYILDDQCATLKTPAAICSSLATGIVMETFTTEPALQIYSGACLENSPLGKHGIPNEKFSGFCLEAQKYPDAPNHPKFPSVALRPGDDYKQTTIYRFKVEQKKE